MHTDYVDPEMAFIAMQMICAAAFIAWLLVLDKHVDFTKMKRRKPPGPWDKK
jgi:hypothetical protein